MRKRRKIKILKCKCGKAAKISVDLVGLCYCGCPKCNKYAVNPDLAQAVKIWNEEKSK